MVQRTQLNLALGASFTLGACTATVLVFSLFAWRRRIATSELKASIPDLSPTHQASLLTEYGFAVPRESLKLSNAPAMEEERAAKIAARARRGEYDEELILEQLARNRVFLGDDGLSKVRDSFVVVVGLGGVGSHCVAALARSGVGRIRVVDFDQVTLSSLNRHALATLADVGAPKVNCVRKRLEQIVPWCRVDGRIELLNSESQEVLLGEWAFQDDEKGKGKKVDWVVDAIDNVDTKVELLRYCASRGIRVVSAMGAGCKNDPTRVIVGDLSETFEDPLSGATRRRLKLLGITNGIICVFSTEKPAEGKAVLQPIDEKEIEKGDVSNLAVLGGFRTRILPVLGTIPAVFGYAAANHVICAIADYPMDYRVGDRGRDKMYDGMLANFQSLMEKLVKKEGGATVGLRVPLSKDDVAYLVEEVFRGKSVVSGLPTRLALVPWVRPPSGFVSNVKIEEKQKYISLKTTDLVLMTKEEAQKHEKEVLDSDGKQLSDYYDEAVLALVKRRLDEERMYDKYR
ncbi:hypothetical protein DV736_g2179, partial [Chaetothyriales sp. CBS 134916]